MSKVWKCKRCECIIDVTVKDEERTFINDGGKLFCSKTCNILFRDHVPMDISRNKKRGKFKKSTTKFKCNSCGRIQTYMSWNKYCDCAQNLDVDQKHLARLVKI